MQSKFGKSSRYPHEIIKAGKNEIFEMLTSNISLTVQLLDEIRRDPKYVSLSHPYCISGLYITKRLVSQNASTSSSRCLGRTKQSVINKSQISSASSGFSTFLFHARLQWLVSLYQYNSYIEFISRSSDRTARYSLFLLPVLFIVFPFLLYRDGTAERWKRFGSRAEFWTAMYYIFLLSISLKYS